MTANAVLYIAVGQGCQSHGSPQHEIDGIRLKRDQAAMRCRLPRSNEQDPPSVKYRLSIMVSLFSNWPRVIGVSHDIPWCDLPKLSGEVESAVEQIMTFFSENEFPALYVPARFIPHLAILNYISSRPHPELSVQTQFMILKSGGFFCKQDPEFLFLSNLHGL